MVRSVKLETTASGSYYNLSTGIIEASPAALLDLQVFLGGSYDSGAGLMNDDLRSLTAFPTTEPYTGLGFDMASGGGEQVMSGVLSTTGNDAIVDWVLVELRDPLNPSDIVAVRAGLLQRDGDVVDIDGNSPVAFEVFGNYYIAIRHRNHLGIMTFDYETLDGSTVSIDFTTSGTGTYGTDAQKTIGSVMALWPGDVTKNGTVKYIGIGNDISPILNAVGASTPTNTVPDVYAQEDVTMDGIIKYTGAGNDRDVVLVTIGGVNPNATRTHQLP